MNLLHDIYLTLVKNRDLHVIQRTILFSLPFSKEAKVDIRFGIS